ncbi:amino acid/polyamine transporter I [Annulohypoxylon maeteangense]|uniref:amino acid/polyamine transporter I n=1 Tax=Annulohypoxylon maeteangense TaxID=1927788 RepID=UPI00200807A3|nr:amino acid/polyamine transporter I [Annulohypoxylon maeteangense]KAI0883455.1 amino acid/polyamine transporter I [Annulohypoxylon maeteangense]
MNVSSKTSNDGRQAAFEATFHEIHGSTYLERDARGLARLGKSQVLKRRFGFLSIFGFSCCILATWETALALFTEAFENGGPAALAWGFPIAWLCSMSVYLCLAEMASIAPISGGQYFWVAILAPRKYKRFCGYLTGWLTSLAWIATLAVGSIFTGTIIQGLIILNYPDYEPKNFHGAFLAWAVIAVAIFVNTVIAGLLPVLEGVILFIHVLGFIAILVTLVYLSPHGTADDVFFRSLNEGNWPTQGLSFCVGFIGNVATFVGADAAIHMAEEIENAAMNVPRAIVTTVLLNGSTGWAMVLAVLFCLGDIDSVINSPTGYPFIQVFYNGTGRAGATVMTVVVVAIIWCAVIGFAATASRMTWSFARDHGLPFHRFIRKVDPRTRVPIVAVVVVTVIPCLLNLIYIGSSTAFNDVISMSVSGLYASYLLPCSFLLWRRVTGQIKPHRPSEDRSAEIPIERDRDPNTLSPMAVEDHGDSNVLLEEPELEWGPWRIPGLLGTLNNCFACLFCVWVLFWDFWPPATPVTGESMNYSVLVTGSVIIFAIARYFLGGKVGYRGPLVDYDVKGFTVRRN